jgi:hypothetical protein
MTNARIPAPLFALAIAACTVAPAQRAQPRTATPTPAPVTEIEPVDPCPLGDGAVAVAVENTPRGAALVFIAIDDEDALRTRIFAIADLHNRQHASTVRADPSDVYPYGKPDVTAPLPGEPGDVRVPDSPIGDTSGIGGELPGAGTAAGAGVDVDAEVADDAEDVEARLVDPYGERDRTYASGRPGLGPRHDRDRGTFALLVMTPSRARVDNLDGGVRLVFTAATPDVDALRRELRLAAEELRDLCSVE